MVEIFYIPGLNSYGDDRLHIGPLKFFRMHEVLAKRLAEYDIKLTPIYPAKETLIKKAEMIAAEIQSRQKGSTIILGHSTGGIIARSLLSFPKLGEQIAGIVTFGCPHKGSHLADLASKLATSSHSRLRLLKLFGYDVKKNLEYIIDLSSENLKKFFQNSPAVDVPIYSLVCTKPPHKLPLAFQMLYSYSGETVDFETDGIVSQESQNWGNVLGPFDLDHLAQIGFFKHLVNRAHKKQTLAEFDRLIKTIANTVEEIRCRH